MAKSRMIEDRKKKAKTWTWFDVVKGLKTKDELEIANSDKSWNESEVESDLEDPNQLKAKRTRRKWNQRVEKRRSCNNKGAEMGLLSRQANREGQEARNQMGRRKWN